MFIHTKPRYPIKDLLQLHNCGRARLYEDINSGKLETYLVGCRRYASPEAVDRYNKICEQESR